MDRYAIVEAFEQNFMTRTEGEAGVKQLENVCEVLGYGEGFMRNRAIEEFLTDNPGAVEALFEFISEWAVRNTDWNGSMEEALEDEGLLDAVDA
jgi:hypothetical protein